jgi:hypothetical protein
MTIAVSGQAIDIAEGRLRVTCTGGASLIEINQDNTGYVPLSGGDIVAGVIPSGASFITDDLGGAVARNIGSENVTLIKFTGAGVISYINIK